MAEIERIGPVALDRFAAKTRAERLIALGRLILAITSIVAIWLDPSEPSRFVAVAYTVLIVYVLYSATILLWTAYAETLPTRFGVVTHVVDLLFVVMLHLFTDAASSPFFAYLVFIVVAAALRWPRRGAMWTGPVVLATFLVIGAIAVPILGDPEFEANRFIIRTSYLAVLGVLITYLGTHEEQLRKTLSRLATWPDAGGRKSDAEVSNILAYAAQTMAAPRAVMVWDEPEEPWVHVATWSRQGFAWRREPPETFTPIVDEGLGSRTFLCLDASADVASVLYEDSGRFRRWSGSPLHRDLQTRFDVRTVLSVAVRGETFVGRLFFLDALRPSPDDLMLAHAVGHYVAARLERLYLAEHLLDAAAVQERSRLARDLHDGVLQSLTAIDLKLEALALGAPSSAVRESVKQISELVQREHAELRRFVHGLPQMTESSDDFDLGRQLGELPARVERQWDVRVKLVVESLPQALPAPLARSIYLMVREAVANAARHAEASNVTIEIAGEMTGSGDRLRLVIADNGRGLGLEGRYDQEEMAALDLGPNSLRARMATLGGSMVMETSPSGTRLEFTLYVPIS